MKVCLGQINTTPGDFDGNKQALFKGVDVASEAECDLVVFPELSIPGYLGQDLIYHRAYIDRNLEVLDELVAYSRNTFQHLNIVVGYIARNEGAGKPFHNMLAVIKAGKIVGRYAKQLIPFYDVFDELRYFEPGTEHLMLEVAGKRVGFAICEDLWNDKGADDYSYENNPLKVYRQLEAEVVVSINSSPFVKDKPLQRLKIIGEGSSSELAIVYVNQCGGQDELVFDGNSFVLRGSDLVHISKEMRRDTYEIVSLEQPPLVSNLHLPEHSDNVRAITSTLYELLVLGLRDYTLKSGFSQIVLASSGGVDSAVVCKIACDAVGATNVHAIRMPSRFSSDHSREDAILLHKNLGCWDYEIEINHEDLVESLNERFDLHKSEANLVHDVLEGGRYNSIANENIQARLRDLYVMHFSNAFGAMPLSTGNKTESACGYYTHFDMNFSYAPIKDLYKFEVMQIARDSAEVPDNVWQKKPSAELAEGQTDEESLMSYAVLDPIVRAYVEEYITTFDAFCSWVAKMEASKSVVTLDRSELVAFTSKASSSQENAARNSFQRIISLMGKMEYKRRQTCPGTKVSKVAFGIGRRIPIVEKWS